MMINDQMIMTMIMMIRWVMSTLTKEPDTHRMTLEQVAEKSEVKRMNIFSHHVNKNSIRHSHFSDSARTARWCSRCLTRMWTS